MMMIFLESSSSLSSLGENGQQQQQQHQGSSGGEQLLAIVAAATGTGTDPAFAQFRDQTRFWIQRVAVPLLLVIGVFGNLITVIIMTRRRMRSTTNMYLAALALVDMFYLMLTFLLGLSHYPNMAQRRFQLYWHLRPFLMMLTDACSNTSVWLTVTFTIERYIAVRYPMKGKVWCTEARARMLITSVFVFGILFASPVPFEWKVIEKQLPRQTAIANGSASNSINFTQIAADLIPPAPSAPQQQRSSGGGSSREGSSSSRVYEDGVVLALDYSDFGRNETYKTIYYWSTAVIFYFVPLISLTLFNGYLIKSVHQSKRERNKMTAGGQKQQTTTTGFGTSSKQQQQLCQYKNARKISKEEPLNGVTVSRPQPPTITTSVSLSSTMSGAGLNATSLQANGTSIVITTAASTTTSTTASDSPKLKRSSTGEPLDEAGSGGAGQSISPRQQLRLQAGAAGQLLGNSDSREICDRDNGDSSSPAQKRKLSATMGGLVAVCQTESNQRSPTTTRLARFSLRAKPSSHILRDDCQISPSSSSSRSQQLSTYSATTAPSSAQVTAINQPAAVASGGQLSASSQERRITIMLIAVVILFLVCQIPSAAMLLYTSVRELEPNTNEHALVLAFGNIFNFLMAVNAAGNFILYSFLSKKYRRTFVILFCYCLKPVSSSGAAGSKNNYRFSSLRTNTSTNSSFHYQHNRKPLQEKPSSRKDTFAQSSLV